MSPSGVEQLAPLFSCFTPNDTTSVKQLRYSYCFEKQILVYAHKNRFLDIFPYGPVYYCHNSY